MSSEDARVRDAQPADEALHASLDDGPRSIHAHVTRPVVQRLVQAHAHKVLDLGCGNGWFAGALERCGYDLTATDHDAPILLQASRQHPMVRFQHMDVMAPIDPALRRAFDAVVAIDLIDCVPMPRKLIETALAALKPGGLLIVTSAYHGYAKNLALALAGRFDTRWDPLLEQGRMKFFSRATLTQLLQEFPLHDLRFETVGRIPMFARSMILSATTESETTAIDRVQQIATAS